MDSPFDGGDLPNLDRDEHWYQIGDQPLYLRIAKEQGKCRLSFLYTRRADGTPLDEPVVVHLATFVSDGHAISVAGFLDVFAKQLNDAIRYYEDASRQLEQQMQYSHAPTDITQLVKQEPKHGSQN